MGGVFGVCSRNECVTDLFFGTDYHSHLGSHRGGMATYNGQFFSRSIHDIENAPFRTKFESDIPSLSGNIGIGCISDNFPQPIILHSKIGTFAVVTVGQINNKKELVNKVISADNAYFTELSGGEINDTELAASLVCRKNSIAEGIAYTQGLVDGSLTMLVCADGGIYAARDKYGRTPLSIGIKDDGHCISFESFAYINLGYKTCYELGPGEVVFVSAEKITPIIPKGEEMKVCSFLWTYYGYPTSTYEGVNVEEMRNRCGSSIASQDKAFLAKAGIDYVAGIPDSGTGHAIGYANYSGAPFARPLIKYTPTWPRSFLPQQQNLRSLIAHMKLSPVNSLIENKKLLFIEDSIVRGTQISKTVDFLFACGVKEIHIRSASPPVLFKCKYLNFTRSNTENELLSRQIINSLEGEEGEKNIAQYAEFGSPQYNNMVEMIRKHLNLKTLSYHSLDGLLNSIGIDKCKLCTYCYKGE